MTAAELFTELTGSAPAAAYSAPGRVNLIGEHTDYNEGFVFPFAINGRTSVAVGPRADRRIRVISTVDRVPVEVAIDDLASLFPSDGIPEIAEWAAYPLGVAWALLDGRNTDVTGLDMAFDSTVPVGAGLSSSAALEGATSTALNDQWSLNAPATELAIAGRRAENEAVGAPTGIMDQMSVMHAEADAALFLDCRTLEHTSVSLGFATAGLEILVIDTRTTHAHSTGGYRERRASCELGARLMGVSALRDLSVSDLDRARDVLDDVTFRRVRHIVTENERVLDTVGALRSTGPESIGSLLALSHASMRDDFEISTPELDLAVNAAIGAGALGARMTGGGFGGAAIALVRSGDSASIAAAVLAAFADAELTTPHTFTVTPSDGPRRDA